MYKKAICRLQEEKVEHVLKRISELQAQVEPKLKEYEKRTVIKKLKDVTEVRYIKCECTAMKEMYKYAENLHSGWKENSSYKPLAAPKRNKKQTRTNTREISYLMKI